jgi:small-conductance mechanosensitive channel/CRP-like cAMP-binding protein
MNMRETIHKIGPPASICMLFAILTLFSGTPSFFFGQEVSDTFHTTFGYIVQICLVLSSMFLLIRLMNVVVWDSFIAKILNTSVPRLIKDLFATLIVIIGITVIVGTIFQKPVTGIWATSSVIGFVLGFALRNLILDIFTGLAINVDGSYKIGDWIHVHSRNEVEYIGCILEINWRTTCIKTTENNIIVVPNSTIGQAVVTNFSAPDPLSRFELLFHFDFSIPLERCLRVLLAGAKQAIGDEGIEGDPEPKVKVNKVTDMSVEYMVRYWIYPAKTSPSRARHLVIQNILHNLSIAEIKLAYPKRDIFYSKMPANHIDGNSLKGKIAILSSIELFHNIKQESLNILAESVKILTFNASETVVKIGDEGNSMFVIIEGLLDVYIYNESEHEEVKVNSVYAGQFFGEMALLTGEPRSATIVAVTDVVAYEITYDNMMAVVNYDPEILEIIGQVIAERQMQQKYLLEYINNKALTEETKNMTDEILRRIKSFFGLVKDAVTHHRRIL